MYKIIRSIDALSYVRAIVEAIDSCAVSINQIFLNLVSFLVEMQFINLTQTFPFAFVVLV